MQGSMGGNLVEVMEETLSEGGHEAEEGEGEWSKDLLKDPLMVNIGCTKEAYGVTTVKGLDT